MTALDLNNTIEVLVAALIAVCSGQLGGLIRRLRRCEEGLELIKEKLGLDTSFTRRKVVREKRWRLGPRLFLALLAVALLGCKAIDTFYDSGYRTCIYGVCIDKPECTHKAKRR